MSIGMGMRHVTIEVRALLSLGPATWALSQESSQDTGEARKTVGQGFSVGSIAPLCVVDTCRLLGVFELQELWSLGPYS